MFHLTSYLPFLLLHQNTQNGFRTEYLAGLWKSHLVACLMWWNGSITGHDPNRRGRTTNPYYDQKCLRPTKFRAPSWSWASIDGAISHHRGDHFTKTLEIVSCSVTLASSDLPFGEVTGGSLKVTGDMKRAAWIHANGYQHLFSLAPSIEPTGSKYVPFRRIGSCFVDSLDDLAGSEGVFRLVDCLLICPRPRESSSLHPSGLVVAFHEPDVCRRIGWFTIDSESTYPSYVEEHPVRRTITII